VKIHIVQKGDTLWKIAQKYGVNFEALKNMNSHLSNPDMIMPGMKIKVPTKEVPVKKEAPISFKKEAPFKKEVPKVPHPFAEQPLKPYPAIEEEKEKPIAPLKEMPKMPYIPKMPQIPHFQPEIDINNYYHLNMANIPNVMPQVNVMPQAPPPQVQPEVKEPEKPIYPTKEMPEMPQIPEFQPQEPMYYPPQFCVPISPVMPGYGPIGYPCGPMPYAPFPQAVSPEMMPEYEGEEDMEMPEMPQENVYHGQQMGPMPMHPGQQVSPEYYGPTPGAYGPTPGAYGPTPGAYGPTPGAYGPTPGAYGPTPGAYGPTPGAYGPTPGAYGPTPGAYGPTPGVFDPTHGTFGPTPYHPMIQPGMVGPQQIPQKDDCGCGPGAAVAPYQWPMNVPPSNQPSQPGWHGGIPQPFGYPSMNPYGYSQTNPYMNPMMSQTNPFNFDDFDDEDDNYD
jgi:morphogenetic protein associated with SpoVID